MAILALGLLPAMAAAQDDEEGEKVRGTLIQDVEGERQPVEGVRITALDEGGAELGTAVTGPEGDWELALPGPGDYQVAVDEETLPDEVGLRDPERNPLDVSVRAGQARTVLFPLGEGRVGADFFPRLVQAVADGLKFGLIIAMASVGLSLIFGTTGLINFAHGELVTFGAIAAWGVNAAAGGPTLQLIPAAVVTLVMAGILGAGLERGIFHPLRKRGTGLIALLVISIGLSLLLRHILLFMFGGRSRPYLDYAVQTPWSIGPVGLTPRDLAIMLLSTAALVGVGLLLQRTKIGKAMRAVSDNRDLAESSGIDVQRVILFVWVFGASLAALGGVFQGMAEAVNFNMGFRLLLLMFAAVILGGLGTAYGAMAGGIVIGLITQVSTLWFPSELKNAWALGVLVIVLLIRPQGILGRAERIG